MKFRPRISLRWLLLGLSTISILLAWTGCQLRVNERERIAAEKLSLQLEGPECPWPISSIVGEEFFQHVRGIQAWELSSESSEYLADLIYLQRVHIRVSNRTSASLLPWTARASDFRTCENLRHVQDLYIDAPFDDDILLHFRSCRLSRLVLYQTRIAGSSLATLSPNRLHTIMLRRSPINDGAMKSLSRFHKLRHLLIHGTDVTDAGIEELRLLDSIELLVLVDLNINDQAIRHLPRNLKRLVLRQVPITDEAIRELALFGLEEIQFLDTKVTAAGIGQLKTLLPSCKYRLSPERGVESTAGPLDIESVFYAYPGNASY